MSPHRMDMPFVVCAERGGPFDDEAFAAGWSCAQIDHLLERMADIGGAAVSMTLERMVVPSVLPQLDLIAMRHGFSLSSEEADADWAHAIFTLERDLS